MVQPLPLRLASARADLLGSRLLCQGLRDVISSLSSKKMQMRLEYHHSWSFSECVCANPGSGQFLQILLIGAGYGVFLSVLKTKAVLACGPRLDLVHL